MCSPNSDLRQKIGEKPAKSRVRSRRSPVRISDVLPTALAEKTFEPLKSSDLTRSFESPLGFRNIAKSLGNFDYLQPLKERKTVKSLYDLGLNWPIIGQLTFVKVEVEAFGLA